MFLTVVPVVRMVLVLTVAPVSAGAEMYNCIRWGSFQHTLAEHWALLIMVKHGVSYSHVSTTGALLDDFFHKNTWRYNLPCFPNLYAIGYEMPCAVPGH